VISNPSRIALLQSYEEREMHRQITKKVIESVSTPDTRELLLRDTQLKGFGIRISPSGTKTFFAEGFYKPKGVGKPLSRVLHQP
jgi:hypothetical protein